MDADTEVGEGNGDNNGWSSAADAYVKIVGPCMIPYANELMRILDGRLEGKRVLEVGAGPGWYGIEAVRKGGAASVVITDSCAGMIRLGHQLAKQEGIDLVKRIKFAQEDGCNLTEPDKSFDAVLCLNTPTVLPEMKRDQCVAEIVRVLKPGGLVVLSAYSGPEQQKWFDPFLEALKDLSSGGGNVPDASVIYSHGWNTQQTFKSALEEEKRGLKNVRVVNLALPWLIPQSNLEAFCAGFANISPHITPLLSLVPDEMREKIPQALNKSLKATQNGDDGPVMLDMMHLFAFACRK